MRRFAALYHRLDTTTSTTAKAEALRAYFRQAAPADAAWALWLFSGRRLKRVVPRSELRAAAAQVADLPEWLIDECLASVGDFGETLALLLPDPPAAPGASDPTAAEPAPDNLAELITTRIVPLARLGPAARARSLRDTWATLPTAAERFLFHKLISGTFRVGVSRTLALRALAEAFNLPRAVVEARAAGRWDPTPADFARLTAPEHAADRSPAGDAGATSTAPHRPYPFCLARPLPPDVRIETLGPRSQFLAEWKFDGIRAQLIARDASHTPTPRSIAIWSRGEELISDNFPDVLAAAGDLPRPCVLDGELLAYDGDRPLGFAALQTRINRVIAGAKGGGLLFYDVPVVFVAFDLLELDGEDLRAWPLRRRRAALEDLLAATPASPGRPLRISPLLAEPDWPSLTERRATARALRAEGLMLKHADAPYTIGRSALGPDGPDGDSEDDPDPASASAFPADATDPDAPSSTPRGWYKWKLDPFAIDAVLIHAQRGSGRRAALYTDYTFAVWTGPQPGQGRLVPIAKAYSGLTDAEIARVDAFIRANQLPGARSSAFVSVKPVMVFQIAFQGVQESRRHAAGLALRFPRIARIREDKPAEQADTVASVRALLESDHPGHAPPR